MSESTFTGPGEVLLAPDIWGDVVPIQLDGSIAWSIGKHAFLAATAGVTLSTKSQGFGKALCKHTDIMLSTNLLLLHSFWRGAVRETSHRSRCFVRPKFGCHRTTKTRKWRTMDR